MGPFANMKKSRSFNAVQNSGDDCATPSTKNVESGGENEQTTEDLRDTITALRQSIATHANANAETLEHFTTLQKAHDTLYSEHVHLQEQMDDAVELLKYLKEEKCSNESKIKELNTEIGVLKESSSGKNVGVGVVTSTIANLTKEKMELEQALKDMEEERQKAQKSVEQYERERKELMEKINQYEDDNIEEGGLTQKIVSLYEQANSQKEHTKKREDDDVKLKNLLSSVTEEKNRVNESLNRIQLENDSLLKEQETMKSQITSLQHQEDEINQLKDKLSDALSHVSQLQRERNSLSGKNGEISPAEGHNELLLENESLKYKIKDLEDQIEHFSVSAAQKDEVHAQLEKEMQERLAKRLAVQLHESKLAMESQIRKELQEEYGMQSSSSHSMNKSKSFHDSRGSLPQSSGHDSNTSAMQNEIEQNLRTQLQQVKQERERWTREQEEFQQKVLLSQQQLSQVRDGYKKKLDREKARVKELEFSVTDREAVIEKISDEYRRAMDELDKVEMRQSSMKEAETKIHEMQLEMNRLQNSHLELKKLKTEMAVLKQKYHDNDEELQNTLSQLEQLNVENEGYVRMLEAYESSDSSSKKEGGKEFEALQTAHNELKDKYKSQKEELDTTLQQLEALNNENGEYLSKIDALEIAVNDEKKALEDMQQVMQKLENDKSTLASDLSRSEEERNKLQQSHLENKQLCSDMEAKLKATKEEIAQNQSIVEKLEAKQEALVEEKDKISAELGSTKDKLSSLENQYETVTREKEETVATVQDLTKEVEELRSTIVSSEVAWQDRVDSKVNEISVSHEMAVKSYEERISALDLEIDELKQAKSAVEGQNEESAGRITELEEEQSKLITKDNSQTARIEELEQEKTQLEQSNQELRLAADEKNTLASTQLEKIQALLTEKDELSSACEIKEAALAKEREELSAKITSLEGEAEQYKLQMVDKMNVLSKERDELLEKICSHEKLSNEMSASSEALQKELESMRETLSQSKLAKTELETRLEKFAVDHETKLGELSSLEKEKVDLLAEIEQLKEDVNSRQIESQKIDELNSELGRLQQVNKELTHEVATIRTSKAELSTSSKAEIDKLKIDLDNAQDKCRVLEGGLEDLQLEKEDFETENEELASKLADLTNQAKTMLLRNEEMENQLDELAMDYDCRVTELESQIGDLQELLEDKSSQDEGEAMEALGQKHEKALETITNLKKDVDEAQKRHDEKQASVKRLEEETLELRQVVEHLQSENDAAREIKYIVLDLKTKNMDLTESLRTSREQKKAAAEIIERLKAENEKLNNDINALSNSSNGQLVVTGTEKDPVDENQLVPFNSDDDEKRIQMEAELKKYKEIVEKMMKDRSIFSQRLSEMMDLAPLKRRHTDHDGQRKLEKDTPVAMLTSEAHLPFVAQGSIVLSSHASTQEGGLTAASDEANEHIQNLTAENVDLAQRLGGAVAEKEFAMTTLSKLGAKMEELIERNKLLERIADLKSSEAIREGSVYSGAARRHSGIDISQKKQAPPDPDDELVNMNTSISSAKPSAETSLQLVDTRRNSVDQAPLYDDSNSAFGDSTIVSYEASIRKPEPEQHAQDYYLPADASDERRNFQGKNSVDSKGNLIVSRDPSSVNEESTYSPGVQLIKVPGGEYVGQLNKKGQKHGNGKMRYDNGNEYDGQWKANKRDGKGTTRYASGNVYIGMWKSGKRHGFGVFHIEKSGDIYRGNWSCGIKSGPGVYEYADGEIDVSFYSNDIRVGDGVRWSADRSHASRLLDGKLLGSEGELPVEDAMRLTKKVRRLLFAFILITLLSSLLKLLIFFTFLLLLYLSSWGLLCRCTIPR